MVLVGRPDYRIVFVPSRGALEWVTWMHHRRELKPLHLWHHLSWFLFGFYPCGNLELVFISVPSSGSSKTDFVWKTYCVFYIEDFTGLSFIKRFYLSTFGFMIHCWTVMFICMILSCSSLWFQRAQDHRKRSSDAQDIIVFVWVFLQLFVQR